MNELLPLSIGLGLAVGLLFAEVFGIGAGGLVVPGYLALYLTRPTDIAVTIGAAVITFAIVRALSSFLIVYGRRRTAMMILIGYLLGLAAKRLPGFEGFDYNLIGYIIPGLIALWMDRQGVLSTLASLSIVAVVVRLLLLLVAGTELPP